MIPFDVNDTAGQPGGSTLLDGILRRLRDTLRSLSRVVTNDKIVTVTFEFANTDTQVITGLAGPPVSWEIVDKTATADIWRSTADNPRPLDTVLLQSSVAPLTIKVRFT